MLTVASILVAALSLSSPHGTGESAEDYVVRLDTIARAIVAESDSTDEALAVLVLWHSESKFDPLIHAGEPHPLWHQDHGRARCGLQVHRSRLIPDWDAITGTHLAATRRCVAAGLRVLRHGLTVCGRGYVGRERMARGFQAYASGHCGAPSAESLRRSAEWARVVGKVAP